MDTKDWDRDEIILHWQEVKAHLDSCKKQELELRKAIIAQCFSDDQVEGTESIDLGKGWKIKAIKKLSYRCIGTQEDIVCAMSALSLDTRSRLISWKASLSTKEYKLLNEAQKRQFDSVVEIKPGTPTLELIGPK